MGTFHYLANKNNKTFFELGKGSWGFHGLEYPEAEPIIVTKYNDSIPVKINNRKELLEAIFDGRYCCDPDNEEDCLLVNNIADKLELFFDYEQVLYHCWDVGDIYLELLRNHNYKVIASVYSNWEPD